MSLNAALSPIPKWQVFDDAGVPLAGGKLWTYGSGGTWTQLATYTDATASVQHTNPVIFDATGRASIWLGPLAYKMVLTSADGVIDGSGVLQQGSIIWTIDNVTAANFGAGSSSVVVVGSESALQALTPPSSSTIAYMTSYYSASLPDGGGGVFLWDPNATAGHDGGMIIAPGVGGTGRWIRLIGENEAINIRWYGAVGDGSTNDLTAISNANLYAHNSGSNLYVPKGTFLMTGNMAFTSPVVFSPSGILKSLGHTMSMTPVITDNLQHFLLQEGDFVTFPAGQLVKGQWFGAKGDGTTDDGPAFRQAIRSIPNGGTLSVIDATSTYLVGAVNTSDAIIPLASSVHVIGAGDGSRSSFTVKAGMGTPYGVFGSAATSGFDNVTIENIQILGNAGNANCAGIKLDASNSSIRNCRVDLCQYDGIVVGEKLYNRDNVIISGCSGYNNGRDGTHGFVRLVNGNQIVVEDCIFTDANISSAASAYGISVARNAAADTDAPLQVTIRDNQLIGCGIFAIPTSNYSMKNSQIINNFIDLSTYPGKNYSTGIQVQGGVGTIVISGNTIIGSGAGDNIYVDEATINSHEVIITNNRLSIAQYNVSGSGSFSTNYVAGISIYNANRMTAHVSGNTIQNLFGGTQGTQYIFGIFEGGSDWPITSPYGNITYGVNDFEGFSYHAQFPGPPNYYTIVARAYNSSVSALVSATRQVVIFPNVDIKGNTVIEGNLSVSGTIGGVSYVPQNYLSGFQMSINGTNSINIGAGLCSDSTNTKSISQIINPLIKQILNTGVSMRQYSKGQNGGAWPVGGGSGPGWYHVHAILGDAGSVDVGVDTYPDASTLIHWINANKATAGWGTESVIAYRRIGSIYIKSGFYLKDFTQFGDVFFSKETDYAADTSPLTFTGTFYPAVTPIACVPPDVQVLAKIKMMISVGASSGVSQAWVGMTYDTLIATMPNVSGTQSIDNYPSAYAEVLTTLSSLGSPSTIGVAFVNPSSSSLTLYPYAYTDFRGKQ